eukprot:69202_1
MTLNVLIVLLISISIQIHVCASANQPQAKSAATGTTSQTTVGNAIQTANQAGAQEGVTKVKTGDLCEGNPEHGDPSSTSSFMASCATCISKAAVDGESCYLNTFTFRTHCECDSYEFQKCHCYRSLHYVGTFAYIFLPILLLAVVVVIQICKNYKFCPMAKMEAELVTMKKQKAKRKKEGTLQETTGGDLAEELPDIDAGADR